MKKETIKEYTILYQYLLQLKEPTYIFIIQALQHISPVTWWEDFIMPILQQEKKENFKYLDIADLLNVLKVNWEKIFRYLDKKYYKFKYDREYKLVNKIHRIRTIVAHANENDMSPFVFADSLSSLLEYSKLINANPSLGQNIEMDWMKYQKALPEKNRKVIKDDVIREKIIAVIENEVLLKAKSCDNLPPDIRLSVDRTTMRIHSMRTSEEIVGFFNNAIHSERGITVQEALLNEGLRTFKDIKDEVNRIYRDETTSN